MYVNYSMFHTILEKMVGHFYLAENKAKRRETEREREKEGKGRKKRSF